MSNKKIKSQKNKKKENLLKDLPEYDKTDLLFHLKKVITNLNARVISDKATAKYYGWKIMPDTKEYENLKWKLTELFEDVYENW